MEEKSEVIQMLDNLREDGFTCSFSAQAGRLTCLETGKRFEPGELSIVSVLRYEGTKDADDQTVIYAVTDGRDTKGVIIDSYGAYADAELSPCIVNLRRDPNATPSGERPLKDQIK